MIVNLTHSRQLQAAFRGRLRRLHPGLSLFTLLILFPAIALAQSPFDTGFTAMQTLFTGTVAKVASLIAIVVGGYQFAHGEPAPRRLWPVSQPVRELPCLPPTFSPGFGVCKQSLMHYPTTNARRFLKL